MIIVVPVFITSCQVSLNLNNGPVSIYPKITASANAKVVGLPVTRAVYFAKRVNHDLDFGGLITSEAKVSVAPPEAVYEYFKPPEGEAANTLPRRLDRRD